MSSSTKPSSSQSKGNSSNPKVQSGVGSETKITSYFSALNADGRPKVNVSKPSDVAKQKEMLQKMKTKDGAKTLRVKNEKVDSSTSHPISPSVAAKVNSCLKSPLSQIIRKNIEAKGSKKESKHENVQSKASTPSGVRIAEKGQSPTKSAGISSNASQKEKKHLPEPESSIALRRVSKISEPTKVVSPGSRLNPKRTADSAASSTLIPKKKNSETGDSASDKTIASGKSSSCANTHVSILQSPEDKDQSFAGGLKQKKIKRRHFRGGTYSLFLSKKKKQKKKSADDAKDDECSLAGTENSSYVDSDDGNSLMSEDLYPASEKSLADEENNADSRISPMVMNEIKKEIPEAIPEIEEEQTHKIEKKDEGIKGEDCTDLSNIVSEGDDAIPNTPDTEVMQWQSEELKNDASNDNGLTEDESITLKVSLTDAIKDSQDDDTTNECLDISANDTPKQPDDDVVNTEPSENVGQEDETDVAEKLVETEESVPDVAEEATDVKHNMDTSDLQEEDTEDNFPSNFKVQDDDSESVASSVNKNSGMDVSELDDKSVVEPMVSDVEDLDNQRHVTFSSDTEMKDEQSDAQSTIANCVKSRQRIKRRFTDDIVDTDVGMLTLNSSMAVPRKITPPKPDPPKDVIQTFQPVTHSEAKRGPVAKIECIYNSHQDPVKSCSCEDDTYDCNVEEGNAFCQALDSVDDKIIGCLKPVATVTLVRPSVKIPFSLMCEIHLWRLQHHHSCPYCGLFCSQGNFMQCATVMNKKKVIHLYHENCGPKEEDFTPFCLHCGEESGLKKVSLELHMPSPPSFFLSQLPCEPIAVVEKAKISFSNPLHLRDKEEEPLFSHRIEDTGKVLSSVGLRGPEKDEIDRLLQILSEEKITPHLFTGDELYTAASEGDVMKIMNLLAQGADPNQKFDSHEKETAIHAAAAAGHTAVIHLLIQAGGVNDALNERICTPLMLAVENKHSDVSYYLIKNGALTDFKGDNGMSSFHIAAKNGSLDILKVLMTSRDVDINAQDDGGWTPIVWASEHDHYDIVKFLLKRGANPNIKDNEGNTGLHWSAYSGSVDICFLYLDYGCDINAVNELGDTPLHIAARQDSLSCVTLFLSRGADVTIKNKADLVPAECVIDKKGDTYLSLSLNMLLKKFSSKYQHKAEKIVHKDISRGKELIAIPVVNDIDDEVAPLDFLYVTENCETAPMNIDRTITSLQSCHCEDDCTTASCTCASISYQCWYDKEGLLLPNFSLLEPPMLFECNRACSCWSLNCRNRVVQNGMTCRLQLLRTKGKGWGVRTLRDIPKGTFICEYVGEIISDSAADKRADDSYLFDLDNRDGETYCLDARYYGNISRFINHLCEPNLVPVKVYVDHQDINFPRIAFFSSRDIKQYEELGFDYCEKFWVIKYKYFTCDCGSPKCKYSKDTIGTTLANYRKREQEENMLIDGSVQQPPQEDGGGQTPLV